MLPGLHYLVTLYNTACGSLCTLPAAAVAVGSARYRFTGLRSLTAVRCACGSSRLPVTRSLPVTLTTFMVAPRAVAHVFLVYLLPFVLPTATPATHAYAYTFWLPFAPPRHATRTATRYVAFERLRWLVYTFGLFTLRSFGSPFTYGWLLFRVRVPPRRLPLPRFCLSSAA